MTDGEAGRRCPICGCTQTRVEEDVSDEVTVYACVRCASTWAERAS